MGKRFRFPHRARHAPCWAIFAITATPQRRDRLCEMFWEVPDDPRAALRWSLSKLRPVTNAGDQMRLVADRERVQLEIDDVAVDFCDVRRIANGNEATPEVLEEAWEEAGPLVMEDCELPNQPEFATWLEQQRNEQVRFRMRLARRLAVYPPLPPEARERWAERWLMDAPYDLDAANHAVAARRRMGREREAKALEEELGQRFKEAGLETPVWSTIKGDHDEVAVTLPIREIEPQVLPRQSVRFAQAVDKTSLAWASVGSQDNPPLVKAANWLSHLELDWEAPIWSPLFRELAKTHHFIRYDERGCGLSDWEVGDISLDSFVSDLELVVDAAGLERFPLLGISQGAAVSIEYAARHPERVSHLILFGSYAAGWRHTATPEEVKEREAIMVLTETGWGRSNPSYRHIFSQTFMPDATPDELSWFNDFQRRTTSPANAVRFLDAFANIDVRDRLADVQAPTLVLHCREDMRVPMSSGRTLAAQIPNAEFVGLDSHNHLLLGREPASGTFVEAVRRFLQT